MPKIIIFTLLILSACSQKRAPIIDRSSVVYDRSSHYNQANFSKKNATNKTSSAERVINAVSGDNIYTISRKYNIPIRDIINQNNLSPPYLLRVGDKISLPSNQYHLVVDGDTLYGISRQYGMNINNLIAINNLKKPYSITIGEKIKINDYVQEGNTSKDLASNSIKKSQSIKSDKIDKKLPELTIASKNNRFISPVKGKIISKFGPKNGGLYNDGINIKAKQGENVKSAEDGVVAYVGNELRGYGNLIIIKHSSGWISAYAHLDKTKVQRGGRVKKGQNIATVGSTGNVSSPQLYFGLRKGREAVNPQQYIKAS